MLKPLFLRDASLQGLYPGRQPRVVFVYVFVLLAHRQVRHVHFVFFVVHQHLVAEILARMQVRELGRAVVHSFQPFKQILVLLVQIVLFS